MLTQREKPILHIGYGKTATTWFQESFYPLVKDINFYNSQNVRESLGCSWRDLKNAENTFQKLNDEIQRLVICDESMIGRIDNIMHRSPLLKKIFFPAQIIIFIRNQLDKFPSSYSQYIKGGGTAKIHEYLFDDERRTFWEKHDYDKIISLYKTSFGKSNVSVYLYEEFNSNLDNFIGRFCADHHFVIDSAIPKSKRPNSGMNKNLLHLRRVSNYLTKKYPEGILLSNNRKYLMHIPYWFQVANWIFGRLEKIVKKNARAGLKDYIGAQKVKELEDYFAPSNRKLITNHGLSKVKDFHYPGCSNSE